MTSVVLFTSDRQIKMIYGTLFSTVGATDHKGETHCRSVRRPLLIINKKIF